MELEEYHVISMMIAPLFFFCGVVIAKVRRVIGIAWTIMVMMMMVMMMMMVKMVVIMRMTNTDYIILYP